MKFKANTQRKKMKNNMETVEEGIEVLENEQEDVELTAEQIAELGSDLAENLAD